MSWAPRSAWPCWARSQPPARDSPTATGPRTSSRARSRQPWPCSLRSPCRPCAPRPAQRIPCISVSAHMPDVAVDHRRATAQRNAAAILDATTRLLQRGAPLNMRAIAAEAGVSRPTLYAHYNTIGEVVEAVVGRAVSASVAAIEAAEPGTGPADEALERVATASWAQ